MDPGNRSSEPLAEIDGSLMQGELCNSRPQFDGVTVAVAAMAVIAAERQIHGEVAFALCWSVMQGTAAIPLRAGARHGLEGEQVEYLRHRDLGTEAIEVDPWHGAVLFGDRQFDRGQDRSVPFFSIRGTGTGTVLLGSIGAAPPCGRA